MISLSLSRRILILFTVPLLGCIAVTSAEDGGAETTQYLILQGPDDGKCAIVTANSINAYGQKQQCTESSGWMLLRKFLFIRQSN